MPPKITLGPFQFVSVGVKMTGRPKLEDWKGPLQFALWCQKAGPWWIGDLLNSGEDHFGESFAQVCEGVISTEQLSRYASVARRVPLANRRSALSWSAHAVVARLNSAEQRRMLRDAEKNGWTSEELRKEVQKLRKRS